MLSFALLFGVAVILSRRMFRCFFEEAEVRQDCGSGRRSGCSSAPGTGCLPRCRMMTESIFWKNISNVKPLHVGETKGCFVVELVCFKSEWVEYVVARVARLEYVCQEECWV